MKNTKIYTATKKKANGNTFIAELNAVVFAATFRIKEGIQKGDLYRSKNSCDSITAHGTCAPVNSEFVKTINFVFA